MLNVRSKKHRFEAMARLYADDLFRFAVWLCRDRTLADDLVQETFIRAWKAIDSLKEIDKAKSWLITILRREYARTFERKVLRLVDIDDVVDLEPDGDSPDGLAGRDELRRAIAELDPKYGEPLALQVLMGLSISEIGASLELSDSAVMTRVFRARKQLEQYMQDEL